MNIIGIFGASGAGKSTVSKIFEKHLPNSLLISGDIFMMDQMQALDKEIFEKLNTVKEKGVFSSNYFFQTFESQKTVFYVIEKPVTELIKEKIKNEGQGKDYIIIDWLFLPMCNLYEECDTTICVTATNELKIERLTNRLRTETIHKIGSNLLPRYKKGIIENRVKFTALNEYGYQSQYEIENNSSQGQLEAKVKKIISKIKA